ncbi:hypothetical protein FOXG_12007 [Fusarium oxysporum f. sp. lycopersici 4287]|uniref:Uncharacterized protein n=2 Tax=Fusarium oxysporum TaxID=5507 RepID=A0A0J9VN47_FUSO4|nr:hypothetical protein FOXG_12007 [Fusarium oxysporum f. sp. lycopersici 4287]KNB12403.1 hypothetical protein FOXG_12007 [Fusarium oxysporum f. sp. lycopersici 4287]
MARPVNFVDKELVKLHTPLDKNQFEVVKADHIYLKPTGHTKREPDSIRDPDEDPDKPWSKFEVNLDAAWSHNYPLGTDNEMLPYWCHYDLLGLFLPLMGPTLPNSARFNFFLPLTAVYARWCFTIGGSRDINKLHDAQAMAFIGKTGHGPPPAIFQCTWGPGQKSKVDFSLGASMGGQNFAPKQLSDWKTRFQRSQFGLLMN